MTTKVEIQALLRFLSQDAKIPLPTAMAKVKELQGSQLTSPETIAKTSITVIQSIFPEEKQAKSVLASAKRVTKKRSAGDFQVISPSKRSKTPSSVSLEMSPASFEESLVLPAVSASEGDIASTIIYTNRAPLVLAFAVTLLKYTMPSQPMSSRLSLAQAVVSANARSKAVTIGIVEKGTAVEDESWGMGQPNAKVMGREVKVMKRHGYNPQQGTIPPELGKVNEEEFDSQATLKNDNPNSQVDDPALWGLDLEALRKLNGPLGAGAQNVDGTGLPIYSAQNARAYLFKSFPSPPHTIPPADSPNQKSNPASQKAKQEQNLARLLQALDLLYASWAHILVKDELDRRAWFWYVAVRPDIKDGAAGWGGKGEVRLERILEMRRKG